MVSLSGPSQSFPPKGGWRTKAARAHLTWMVRVGHGGCQGWYPPDSIRRALDLDAISARVEAAVLSHDKRLCALQVDLIVREREAANPVAALKAGRQSPAILAELETSLSLKVQRTEKSGCSLDRRARWQSGHNLPVAGLGIWTRPEGQMNSTQHE